MNKVICHISCDWLQMLWIPTKFYYTKKFSLKRTTPGNNYPGNCNGVTSHCRNSATYIVWLMDINKEHRPKVPTWHSPGVTLHYPNSSMQPNLWGVQDDTIRKLSRNVIKNTFLNEYYLAYLLHTKELNNLKHFKINKSPP